MNSIRIWISGNFTSRIIGLAGLIILISTGCAAVEAEDYSAEALGQTASATNSQAVQSIDQLQPGSKPVLLKNALAIAGVARYGRSPIHRDAVEAQIIAGKWLAPQDGDQITLADGDAKTWQAIEADENGWFSGPTLRGGYLFIPVESKSDQVVILHMRGNSMVYVNGQPRTGSSYQSKDTSQPWEPTFDYARLPIKLKKGANELLFFCSRGRLKAMLKPIKAPAMLNVADTTLGDLVTGREMDEWAGVVVINAAEQARDDLILQADWPGGERTETAVPIVGPLAVRKVGFKIKGRAPEKAGAVKLKLTLLGKGNPDRTPGYPLSRLPVLDEAEIELAVRQPSQTRKCTYRSSIDGSVQYYALNPAIPLPGNDSPKALVLSVHGAQVEAINQANAYANKSWCNIVAATNRRPFGYDWEDWGRKDTLEVLEIAKNQLQPDLGRIYLTGHSMGGHGTWILGAQYPDKFGAIAPSAGWISFSSYTKGEKHADETPIAKILRKAAGASDTLSMKNNYKQLGIYILHGGADEVVSAKQSQEMVKHLGEFHKDFQYHEEPGQGHWWDLSDEAGADCVDWPGIFDFFARHYRPGSETVRQVNFTTVNPAVSSDCHWVSIEAQKEPLGVSKVAIRFDPALRRFVGTTENVERLVIRLDHVQPGGEIALELDGQKFQKIPAGAETIRLVHVGYGWMLNDKVDASLKGPSRHGPFKEGWDHQIMLVYGTSGTAQENEWAYAKARYDAEQFWYQGNGSLDVIADVEFDAGETTDRSVVLYGNAETNNVWKKLLGDSPVQVNRRGVKIGDRQESGDDLACLFLQPRLGSEAACVMAVSGTGIKGMRLTERLSYLTAGCSYPDCVVIGPEMLTEGAGGIRAAGIFGNDWSVGSGDFSWRADLGKSAEGQAEQQAGGLPAYIGPDPRPFVMPRGYVCMWASEPMVIDGKMDEACWGRAKWTEDHVDIEGAAKPKPRFRTHSKMLWDDDYFYIAAELEEPHVWGTITRRNAVIFNDNDFEVFIDPDGDGHEYYEFEMNALNTVWNLFMNHPYKNGGQAAIREMFGQQSGVFVDGTLNDPSDEDRGWTLEIAFGWKAMAEYANRTCPPVDGDQWRLGFSRVEWDIKIEDGKYSRIPDSHEHNWIWSPQGVINMHRPETWGYVQFSNEEVGEAEVSLRADPVAAARYLLFKVNYAQEEFKARRGKYATSLEELNLGELQDETLAKPIEMEITEDGYRVMAEVKSGDGTIRKAWVDQAARFTVE